MTIQIRPQALSAIVIPAMVERSTDDSIALTFTEGIADLPAPFNTATVWVACREAWPHNDPDFEGLMFISVVLQGCHRYGQLGANNVFETIDVGPGSIFPTNLALHWLEPKDPDIGFIALQWEVPCDEYEQRLREMACAIDPDAGASPISVEVQPSLVQVQPEDYIGAPPGFPSLSALAG
jgi:hypothetical protein